MLLVVLVRVFITVTGMGMAAVTPQIIADRAARSTAKTRADGRSGRTAKTVADHRTTRRAQTTAYRSLGATALWRANGTTGRSADTRTNRCASTAAHLATDNVAQHPTKTTAYRGVSITPRQRYLRDQQSKNNRRAFRLAVLLPSVFGFMVRLAFFRGMEVLSCCGVKRS